jgi:hypothetical protein
MLKSSGMRLESSSNWNEAKPMLHQDHKMLEGKTVEVDEIEPAERALPIIEDSLRRYSQKRRRGFH